MTRSVPFLDLTRLHASIRSELDEAWDRTVRTSAFIGGEVGQFEVELANLFGCATAAGCNSGTDALGLALRASVIGPGDEVVVPSMTFVATAEAVLHAGATPVFADVDPSTLLLTPEAVDAVRTPLTRAIIPVHLYGAMPPSSHLEAFAEQAPVVVEDAAQAHLATNTEGVGPGTQSSAACYSFFPGKNLGAFGDGGAVVSNNTELVAMVRQLRDHGRTEKYVHDLVGVSSRLDGLQAAILRAKLPHLARWTRARRELSGRYVERLAELPGIAPVDTGPGSARHLFVVRVAAPSRDEIGRRLRERGIATGVHYPVPLTLQPAYRSYVTAHTPVAESAAAEVLSLPLDPLMDPSEVDWVCDQLRSILQETTTP